MRPTLYLIIFSWHWLASQIRSVKVYCFTSSCFLCCFFFPQTFSYYFLLWYLFQPKLWTFLPKFIKVTSSWCLKWCQFMENLCPACTKPTYQPDPMTDRSSYSSRIIGKHFKFISQLKFECFSIKILVRK